MDKDKLEYLLIQNQFPLTMEKKLILIFPIKTQALTGIQNFHSKGEPKKKTKKKQNKTTKQNQKKKKKQNQKKKKQQQNNKKTNIQKLTWGQEISLKLLYVLSERSTQRNSLIFRSYGRSCALCDAQQINPSKLLFTTRVLNFFQNIFYQMVIWFLRNLTKNKKQTKKKKTTTNKQRNKLQSSNFRNFIFRSTRAF